MTDSPDRQYSSRLSVNVCGLRWESEKVGTNCAPTNRLVFINGPWRKEWKMCRSAEERDEMIMWGWGGGG